MRLVIVCLLVLTSGCAREIPSCPFGGEQVTALSAGCLAVQNDAILVVENPRGLVGPPGGSAAPGEGAQCTAHRETFEETGLSLAPGALFHTFDTGFHLYFCDLTDSSGAISTDHTWEVARAYWLPLKDFDAVRWRFEGQGEEILRRLNIVE